MNKYQKKKNKKKKKEKYYYYLKFEYFIRDYKMKLKNKNNNENKWDDNFKEKKIKNFDNLIYNFMMIIRIRNHDTSWYIQNYDMNININ